MAFSEWNLYNILYAVIAAAAVTFASIRCVHMLQLESYQGNMYLSWIRRAGRNICVVSLLSGLIAVLLHLGWYFFYHTIPVLSNILQYVADAAYVLLMLYAGFSNSKKEARKPIVFTGRVIRLLAALMLLYFVFHESLFLNLPPNRLSNVMLMLMLRYLPGMLLPFFVLLGHAVMFPIESLVKRWYFNDARKKLLARKEMLRIGITGSYGKTSTKYILGAILEEQMRTLVTPGSYNTPMGVTRVIREQLAPEYQVFVAEMGARYTGDIHELCNLVQPKYGILTSVGKQHLETFGSYENVIRTKGELLESLPEDGAAFVNGDNPDCRAMYEACMLKDKFLFGLEGEGLYMKAADIEVGRQGSDFTLITEDGQSTRCHTVLLGKHNIGNITGAAALAKYLGLSMEQIVRGVVKIQPVEHRLQLIPGSITVIDDAFNANPSGTKAALEVLKAFAPEKRIVVTPGMIELGNEEDALNEEFGRDLAGAADVVILVGRRHVEPIRTGLLSMDFPESAVIQVDSLAAASEKLPMYTSPGCVVLFENDLPDNYTEV